MTLGNSEAMLMITPIAIVAVIVGGTFLIIQAILNHRIKMRMIDAGNIDENSVKLLRTETDTFKFHGLKWGLILLSGGVGLILLHYIPYSSGSTLPFGIETVSIAIGFLIYYRMIKDKINQPVD